MSTTHRPRWEASERTVINTTGKASTRQVAYLRELETGLGHVIAWPIYLARTGERIDNYRPERRYKHLNRVQASELIAAYKAAK